jgi:hypothetical protein
MTKQTRTKIPENITRVRNAVTGKTIVIKKPKAEDSKKPEETKPI